MLADLGTNWTNVILNVIALVGVIATSYFTWHNRQLLKTPSKTAIGTQTEQANALSALAVAYLAELLRRSGTDPPSAQEAIATAQERVDTLTNGGPLPQPREH